MIPSLGSASRRSAGRDQGLAEADAAVVARHPGVQQDAEAAGLQPAHGGVEQEQVLEHAAGQRHCAQVVTLAHEDAARLDQRGHAVVEA